MGLIALKCPNCGGSIELDDKKEFGFCMHCGQKVFLSENITQKVRIDHSESLKNWERLAEVAYENNNVEDLKKYSDLILEVDLQSSRGWFLKGCVSSRTGHLNEASAHWKKAMSLADVSAKGKNYQSIKNELSYGIPVYAAQQPPDFANSFQILRNIFGEEDGHIDSEVMDRELTPFVSFLVEDLKNKTNVYTKPLEIYRVCLIAFDLSMFSISNEYSCRAMLTKIQNLDATAEYFETVCKKHKIITKMFKTDEDNIELGNLFAVQRMIITDDAYLRKIFIPPYEKYLSKISKETGDALKEYWITNKEKFIKNVNMLERASNRFAFTPDNAKNDEKAKVIETYLKTFVRSEDKTPVEPDKSRFSLRRNKD